MTLVRGGTYVIETPERSYPVEHGMVFLVGEGFRHRVRVQGDRTVTVYHTDFHCRVDEIRDLFDVLERPLVFDVADGRRVAAHHRTLSAAGRGAGSLASAVAASAALADMVRMAGRICPELSRGRRPEYEAVVPVLRYVRDHLADPLDRATLARVAGFSVPHLHTLFRSALGAAPMDVVRQQRMNRARQLLLGSDLPIREIGRLCGFSDPYYFSRAFHRTEGTPPSRYRRLQRERNGAPTGSIEPEVSRGRRARSRRSPA
jgi:AraC-like DNA-binding protein